MDENREFDRKVDTWNTGVLAFMLFMGDLMFKMMRSEEFTDKNQWYIQIGPGAPHVSIEALRLVNTTVVWDMEKRPLPEQIVDLPYFSADIENSRKLDQIDPADLQAQTGV